jgi:hypothetical protein
VGDGDRPELQKRVRKEPAAAASEPADVEPPEIEALGRLAERLQADDLGPHPDPETRPRPHPRRRARALLVPALVVVVIGLLVAFVQAVT